MRQPDRCQVLGGEASSCGETAAARCALRWGAPHNALPPPPYPAPRSCATSTASTPRAPTMATATCSWSASTSTSTRRPAVSEPAIATGAWGALLSLSRAREASLRLLKKREEPLLSLTGRGGRWPAAAEAGEASGRVLREQQQQQARAPPPSWLSRQSRRASPPSLSRHGSFDAIEVPRRGRGGGGRLGTVGGRAGAERSSSCPPRV